MRIAFNPSTVAALTTPPNNKDITFDLRGRNIFARGVEFKGTDTWRPVVDNLTSDSTTSSLSAKQGKTLKALIDGKSNSGHTHAWNSLTHSSTTANQAILTNGSANGWKLYTLNISAWDNAANKAHSHSNKSVLDGITSALVNSWNTAYNFVDKITKADTDKIINKWDEIVNFLAGIDSSNKLNTLLNSKLSVYELADKTNVGAIKNSGIYYSTTDASSSTLTNSPFNNGFTLINMTSYDGGDDLRRSRLAFNAYGEIKVSDDRSQSNTTETWYNILTSKNSGISGSTIKLNGSSITVYSSDTADDRYLKLTGGTMRGNIILSSGTRITKTLVSTSNYATAIDWSVAEETKQYGREIGLHNTGGNDSTGSIAIVPYKTSVEPWSGTVGLFIAKNTLKLDGKNVAFKNDIPSSLKNPYSLTLQANGTTLATYDGSASKIVNFTYANVGAAAKSHTHTSLEPWASYITGDSHAATLKSVFNNNKTSIPRNKFISMLSSAYGNGSYYMGYFLYGYENNPYGGFFVANYDAAYYIGISNGSFSQHRLVYSTDIPSSLKNPHALTISLNGTSQGPYDGSAAKNINITPGSIGAATSGHNHDDRYLKLTGGTMQLGEGLKFHADENYFGTYFDARIISLLDNNDKVCDGGLIIDERGTLDGKEYVTELLRIRDSEFKWKGSNILHSSNSYVTSGKGVINGTEITQVNNANKWTTARSFTIGNTSKSVDGSSNVSWSLSEIGAASSSHNHDGRYAISENYGGFKKSGRLPISGFYQSDESESGGNAPWKGWVHLINCQHSNPENNYALQIAAKFNDNNVFKIRVTDNNVNNTWRNIIHSGNIDSQIVKGAYMTPLTLSDTMLISSGYLASDYTSRYDTQEYMKAAAKYLQKNYSGQSIFGTMAPNSQGFFTANIYSSGFNSNGYPEHITIHYYPHGGTIVNCGTAYGSWYYSSINRDGSSYKLQTARKLWGQSFDGTADVSGTLSGVANIQFSANNAYDIGSNGNASRYIYTHWLGSRSGQKLELGANNSGYGQGLCIDTNLNVGIGTNTPGEKLDVRGKGSFTSGIYSSATISVCSNIEGAEPNQAAIEIRERSRGTTDIAHNYKNAPRIGFHWGNRYWGNLALYNSEFNFLNDDCSGYFNVIANGFKKSSSSDSYVLLGGGGHKAESSLNVANADTTDGVHINWAGTNDNPTYLASWDDSGKAIRAATRANVSVGNADKLDGIHASSGNNKPWGTIPAITTSGFMDIGKHLEFHYDNSTGSDYSTALMCQGNYSNIVYLPSSSGTLALTSQVLTWKSQIIDMRNYSESYWHPVTVNLPYTGYNKIKVSVQLNSGDKPSWATHSSGITCNMEIWATASGWGTTGAETICLNYTYAYCSQNPCGWMQLGYHSLGILFLRGGSRYRVYTDFDATFTPHDQKYTWTSGSYSQNTGGPYTNCPGLNFNKNKIYANLDGYASHLEGGSTPGWGTLTAANGFTNVSSYDYGSRGAYGLCGKNSALYMQLDGYFYQNEGRYRVLDTSDLSSVTNHIMVSQYTTGDTNYPLVWSNQSNTSSAVGNQLYKSWADLYYNPKNKRLYTNRYVGSYANLTQTSMRHIDADLNSKNTDHTLYIGYGAQTYTAGTNIYASTGSGDTTSARYLLAQFNTSAGINLNSNINTRPSIIFRNETSYKTTLSYATAGNEALCFETKNAATSIIFYNGATYAAASDHWYSIINGVQIKNNCLAVGAGWANGVNPNYKLKVGGNGYFTDHVVARSSDSSWLDGQRYNQAGYNLQDVSSTGSYYPWMRQTNTGSAKWFSIGILNNSFYILGSKTSRTENSYDYAWRFDLSNGWAYGNFSNADTVDGYHENSFLRYRGATNKDQEATLWSQIGIKEYQKALPDSLTSVYNFGSVISLPGLYSRFEIYASHQSSTGNGLYYRSGWVNDKQPWRKFIDSSNIGSQSVNYANSAGSASSADKTRALKYTGTGSSEITAHQTDASYMGRSGWASYIICNHGDGSTYYSQTIAMPFWSSPIYRRLEGGTDRGWKKFYTEEAPPSWDNVTNKPSTFTPASHTHTWTSITDKMVAGNEFNIVNAGFKGGMWFNYLPINNRDSTATIQGYHFGNGAKGYTSVIASSFVKNGGDKNQLLRADGGVATFTWSGQSGQPTWLWGGNSQHSYYVYNPSNFSVKYAASAGAVAWDNVTGRPSSLKNPYSLNIFGVAYDGSAAKTVTTSTFISQVSEATSTITDGTMLITSWASNDGFADTNAVNVPYKRKASHLWDYIKAKTDTLYSSKSHTHSYLPLAGGTMNGNARIGHGSGNLYIGNSGNDGWIYTQDIASQLGTDKWNIQTSGAACFGIIHIASKTDGTFNSNIIECNSTIHLNYFSAQDVSLCYGGGKVGIGKSDPLYTLDVAGNGRFQDFVYCNAVYSTTLNHTSSTGHLVIGNKTKEISIRSSNLPDLNALYLYQKFSTNVYYSANKGFGIRPYYLSNALSNMLPTETVYNNKYSVLTVGDKVQAISCIIADKTPLMSGIKGTLIRFIPGDDGQIVLLKDLNNYGVGSNGYFWVQPKGCSIIRSNNSDVYIADGNISSSYDDGGSRFFIYAKTHKVWIEFFCG